MHIGMTYRRMAVSACSVISANKGGFVVSLFFLIAFADCRCMAQDCRTIAAAPPLFTFGGPATVPRGEYEAAFAGGFGGILFGCTHKLGSGWFGRWRRGLTDRFDLGTDFEVIQHNDKGTATAKIAARYQLTKHLRLEMGIGGADDSDGKSLNSDLGITVGTTSDRPVNHFASLRVAAARGYPGNVCCFGGGGAGSDVGGTNVPPGNYLLLGSLGRTARISDNARFVYEFGFGGVLTHFSDRSETGRIFTFGMGVLFKIPRGTY
jgi:hypothetical protein